MYSRILPPTSLANSPQLKRKKAADLDKYRRVKNSRSMPMTIIAVLANFAHSASRPTTRKTSQPAIMTRTGFVPSARGYVSARGAFGRTP